MTQPPLRVLTIDDDEDARFALVSLLTTAGYDVCEASNGEAGLALALESPPDLILLDVVMPGMSGFEVTKALDTNPATRNIPIIFLSAQSEEEVLPELRAGAIDFIRKPYKREELLMRIALVLRVRSLSEELDRTQIENRELRQFAQTRASFGNIIGKSQALQQVFTLIDKLKETRASVLITGESGTGKELVAGAIHFNSPRRDKPFVAQNVSAFAENLLESELFGHVRGSFTGAVRDKQGLFEIADGGTFFLDELGEMSAALQVKLLRVLQEGTFIPVGGTKTRTVDVRIVAATNRDLHEMVRQGTFREDLFYRLNVVNIQLPPLRDRVGDLPLLVDHFLERGFNRAKSAGRNVSRKTLSAEALNRLAHYEWPGNIRQLENELERAAIMSGTNAKIEVSDLSPQILGEGPTTKVAQVLPIDGHAVKLRSSTSLHEAIQNVERQMIDQALRQTHGNKSEAARVLGISRSSLISKAQEFGID